MNKSVEIRVKSKISGNEKWIWLPLERHFYELMEEDIGFDDAELLEIRPSFIHGLEKLIEDDISLDDLSRIVKREVFSKHMETHIQHNRLSDRAKGFESDKEDDSNIRELNKVGNDVIRAYTSNLDKYLKDFSKYDELQALISNSKREELAKDLMVKICDYMQYNIYDIETNFINGGQHKLIGIMQPLDKEKVYPSFTQAVADWYMTFESDRQQLAHDKQPVEWTTEIMDFIRSCHHLAHGLDEDVDKYIKLT